MIYRRSIRLNMLWCLRRLYFEHGLNWKKVTEIDERVNIGSNFPLLRYWGLIESEEPRHRITLKGIDFILGRVQINKYIWLYNQVLQQSPTEEDNPLIWAWSIAPQEISKELVLADAVAYQRNENKQYNFI